MDTRLIGRVTDTVRTVSPLLAVSASALDLQQPPTSGSVRAQVAARLADGTFRVLIDGKALKLALPADIKPGDVLQLRVVGRDADPAATRTQAGAAGKGVSTVGQLVADLVKLPKPVPTRQTQPVLDVPPEHSADLPTPLARALERSGLFYESHQARWVNGDFPLDRLLEEPQARAGRPDTANARDAKPAPDVMPLRDLAAVPDLPAHAAEAAASTASSSATARSAASANDAGIADEIGKPALPSPSRDAETRAADKGNEIVARDTLNLVRQQLDALETRQLTWFGEIWPGQTMRWDIGEEPEARQEDASAAQEWDSRFSMELPALGNVGAELVLAGNRLRLKLSAQDEATAAMMRDAGRELMQALEAAGIQPVAFEVQHREPAF